MEAEDFKIPPPIRIGVLPLGKGELTPVLLRKAVILLFMRYLGIDYGSKRVGVAVSDEEGKFALPFSVVPNDKKLLSEIKKIITEKQVGAVVFGDSKDFKGEDNAIMTDIRRFKVALEKETGLTIFLEPEFMTSAEADRMNTREPEKSRKSGIRLRRPKTGNEMLDASAAAIILQSFLNHKS